MPKVFVSGKQSSSPAMQVSDLTLGLYVPLVNLLPSRGIYLQLPTYKLTACTAVELRNSSSPLCYSGLFRRWAEKTGN